MWIKIKNDKPKQHGLYVCFGLVNKGSEHEQNARLNAYWNGEEYGFTDKDGEDLIGINDSITHWFDFSSVENPS